MADARTDSQPAPSLTSNRSTLPQTPEFREYISSKWAQHPDLPPSPRVAAAYAAARRLRLSALYPGTRLIVPAGPARVRSNDTDYAYRAHSAFAHLTGWGSDAVPDSVLVLEPTADG
ncbi:MAG: aminopeptidase P N-terminal domain-containing protein, partial [Pseudolysinimonas sp.]